jgi:hypothetical protein
MMLRGYYHEIRGCYHGWNPAAMEEMPDGMYFLTDDEIRGYWPLPKVSRLRRLTSFAVSQWIRRMAWLCLLKTGKFAAAYTEFEETSRRMMSRISSWFLEPLWTPEEPEEDHDGAPATRDAADRALSLSSLGRVYVGNVRAEDE